MLLPIDHGTATVVISCVYLSIYHLIRMNDEDPDNDFVDKNNNKKFAIFIDEQEEFIEDLR